MKYLFILLLGAAFSQQLQAQRGGSFVLSYPIAFPMGDLSDYIGKTSFRGISMEFNKRQGPNVDIGLEVGWNLFYGREDEKVYTDKTASVSGVQYRYTNAAPLLAGAKYYLASKSIARPYVGLGLGTLYVNRATDFGLYRISNEEWQFCVRPEVGVKVKGGNGMSAFAGLKYYQAFDTGDLDAQSFLSINIGFIFSMGM